MERRSLSSEDVRTITNEQISIQIQPLHDALTRLTEQHATEILERRSESKELNQALTRMTTAITEISANSERVEDRFRYIEKSAAQEIKHLHEEHQDHTKWLDSNSSKIGVLEVQQGENRKHLNIGWAIIGTVFGLIAAFGNEHLKYHRDQDNNTVKVEKFTEALEKMTEAVSNNAETHKSLEKYVKEHP